MIEFIFKVMEPITKGLEFFSERARGAIITIGGVGLGTAVDAVQPAIISDSWCSLPNLAYGITFIVGILTTISYAYRFYIFCKSRYKVRNKKN